MTNNGIIQNLFSFEEQFSSTISPEAHAFSFWKGRVALYAILKALGIGEGDEVILPGYTCVVVPNAIIFSGAKPRYIDNQSGTYHIDPDRVESFIGVKTKAIIIQHTYGIPGPLEELESISNKYNIPLIEDCAHSLGSTYLGRPLGTWGKAAFYSSQWSKPFTTGLGGLAITSDDEFAKKLSQVCETMILPPYSERAKLWIQYQIYQNFYSPQIYWQAQNILHLLGNLGLFVGSSSTKELEGLMPIDYTWAMSKSQKLNGIRRLEKIKNNFENRRKLTKVYDRFLEENKWQTAYRKGETIFLRYPIRVGNKSELLQIAKAKKVELGSWFETPLHPISLTDHYKFGYWLSQCPHAEKDSEEIINLPLHEWVSEKEANCILEFFMKFALPPK